MTTPNRLSAPAKPLPVTLLSGFLGSGKTTLLQHILKSDHGLRIAVIVNDIGAINIDANLIRHTTITQTHEKIIALQNGCICCTLRGDLLEALVRLAMLAQCDYVVVESSGISEPQQVAETFDARLVEQMGELLAEGAVEPEMQALLQELTAAGGMAKFARLDTAVTVLDAFTLLHDFDTAEMLSARRSDVEPADERTVSDLLVDQIEFADVVVLNKTDMVSAETLARITSLVHKLNPGARVLEARYSAVPILSLLNTGRFDLQRAQTGPGWLQDLHAMTVREMHGRTVVTPNPETDEYNVRNFVYRRHRPFHPRRLWGLVCDKFVLQMEQDEEDEEMGGDEEEESGDEEESDQDMDDDDGASSASAASSASSANDTPPPTETILHNKRTSPLFHRLFRSKGEFYLATRPHRAGEWSQAGAILTLTGGRPWFCTLPAQEYATGTPEIDALVQHDIAAGGEWGDRRQELVFIGEGLDTAGLERVLDACLLTDDEWAKWCAVMRGPEGRRRRGLERLFDDGFPEWADDHEH